MTHSFNHDDNRTGRREYVPPIPPPPATYYGHPAPAPKRDGARRFAVLFALAALALLAIAFCAFGIAAADRQRTGSAAADTRATPTRTPDPTATAPKAKGTPTPTPKAAESADAPAVKPQKITARQWSKIARSPDKYTGKAYVVYGAVTQADSATGESAFRANVDGVRHTEWWEYDTNAILSTDGNVDLSDFVKDDSFRAEVLVAGEFSYESAMGADLAVPHLIVTKIKRS